MLAASKIVSARSQALPRSRRRTRHALFLAFLASCSSAASLLILKFAPVPFFWIWAAWAAVSFVAIFQVQSDWPRAILLNFGIVACLLAGGEAYLSANEYTSPVYPDGYFKHDDVLGWAPVKGIQTRVTKLGPAGLFHHPREQLYDVTYTIDSNRLRVAPPYRIGESADSVLFFGCSFTFGEGLGDNETLPYQVGVESGGLYRTFNFSFHGYAPNQMLASIEDGIVQRVVDPTPRYAYYIALPNHVWRVAGRVAWGGHAPRYLQDTNGTVYRAGNFEHHNPITLRLGLGRVAGQLKKSAIWRVLSTHDSRITDDDIRLYFAVVRRAQELLKAQYPEIQFRILLWPNQEVPQQRVTYEKMQDGFRRMGIPFDLVADILPGYKTNKSKYLLGPLDTHPNALANRLLAQYILGQITPASRRLSTPLRQSP
jgi:hypothetical protein